MDDLISREEAMNKIMNKILLLMKDMKLTSGDTTVWQDCIISPTEAAHALKWMPSVDAVDVVRCKNCKHYEFSDNRAFGFPVKRCEWTGFEDVDDDDFCSRAERKEE